MSTAFFKHINKFIVLSESDFQHILSFFEAKSAKKKEIIMEAGQKCNANLFVVKGCLQQFYINHKGIQKTLHFALENWWITDDLAFQNNSTTDCSIQAVENCDFLSISHEKQEQMLAQYPIMEKYFRFVYQRSYGSAQVKMRYLFDLSKEEIYFNFIEQFPEFAQRVPQYLIASYLGLTPEYVSEIRNKKRS